MPKLHAYCSTHGYYSRNWAERTGAIRKSLESCGIRKQETPMVVPLSANKNRRKIYPLRTAMVANISLSWIPHSLELDHFWSLSIRSALCAKVNNYLAIFILLHAPCRRGHIPLLHLPPTWPKAT